MGRLLLIVGNVLAVGAFFFPWLNRYPSYVSYPQAEGYSPWIMIQQNDGGLFTVVALFLLLVVLGTLVCSILVLRAMALTVYSILRVLAWLGIGLSLLLGLIYLFVLPYIFELSDYPTYSSTPNIGAGLELVGFVFLLIGLMFFDWNKRHSAVD